MEGRLGRFLERRSGVKKLKPQIIEALDSLREDGIMEATGFEIMKKIEMLHPPKHWWRVIAFGTLYGALSQLEDSKQLLRAERKIDQEHGPFSVKYVYHKVEPQESQTL